MYPFFSVASCNSPFSLYGVFCLCAEQKDSITSFPIMANGTLLCGGMMVACLAQGLRIRLKGGNHPVCPLKEMWPMKSYSP